MFMIQEYYEWLSKKVDDLTTDDKYWVPKSCLYGALSVIPEALATIGGMVFVVAGINLARGKGWTVCPKD